MSFCHSWNLDDLIEAYQQHQRRTRGLSEGTLRGYAHYVRLFVRHALGDDPVDVSCLTAESVVEFVGSMTGQVALSSMKPLRTAVRSFLRYLRQEGVCAGQLEAAIPRVAAWRLSTVPRRLSDDDLTKVLASVDTPTSRPCGQRDRAIVWCLATLGLRPGEIADLELDDIDWREGTIRLRHRKNRRSAVMPLPREAGRATAAYLHGHRPVTDERRVFVQHVGPRRGQPIGATAVTEVVSRTFRRAGIDAPMVTAYVFRHTVASRVVSTGGSLKDVADFLGHNDLDTSAIYAKVDLAALREVAMTWPGAGR